ncbi:hypothetical protein FPV67DRAFT_1416743 [Lyophyllum atratum]|nr:hypothetical protein FPV67DRAFT_1416743 [Lyophyllum atratum]
MEPPAVHRCLLVPDIIHLLCDTIVAARFGNSHLPTLAVLARTCRLFYEPALDRIWMNLDGIVPLIKCMPSDLWKLAPSVCRRPRIDLQRAITLSDLDRLLFHSRRVKGLAMREFNPGKGPMVPAKTYEALKMAIGAEFLLPNVTRLQVECDQLGISDYSLFPYIDTFLSPRIISLTLILTGSGDTRLPLFTTLRQRYPSLEDFKLRGGELPPQETHVLSDALLKWDRLRTLTIDGMTPIAFLHVIRLRNLHTLSIDLRAQPDLRLVIPKKTRGFPALISLRLVSNLPTCIRLLQTISSRPLEHFDFENCNGSSAALWNQMIQALRTHCSHSSLRFLRLVDEDTAHEDEDGLLQSDAKAQAITLHSLRHLFAFRNIQKVHLHISRGFNLDNVCVQELAMAWRKLQILFLRPSQYYTPSGHSLVTLDGLAVFAEYCQDLVILSMLIDARVPPSCPIPAQQSCGKYPLRLSFGESQITRPSMVASFLSALFPQVYSVSGMRYGWMDVEDILLEAAKSNCGGTDYNA